MFVQGLSCGSHALKLAHRQRIYSSKAIFKLIIINNQKNKIGHSASVVVSDCHDSIYIMLNELQQALAKG